MRLRERIPALMRERTFRRYWTGQTVSLIGGEISLMAIPLAAVLVLGADAAEMGRLKTAELLPALLLNLPLGAWADRQARRRRAMIAADLARAALLATLPVAYLLDALTLGQLYATAVAVGALTVLFDACNNTLFVTLVPSERYVQANSLVSGSRSVSWLVGPGIGGLLVQILTAPFALLADAFTYLVSARFLARSDPVEPVPEPVCKGHFTAGLRWVVKEPSMRALFAWSGTIQFFNYMFHTLFVLYVTVELGLNAGVLGAILSAGAIGGLVGAASSGRIVRRFGIGPSILCGSVVFTLPLVLVPLADGPLPLVVVTLFAAEFLSCVGVMVIDIAAGSLQMVLIPQTIRSRGHVLAEHLSFLDSCLELTRATDDWPAESRFRWCVESLWSFRQWADARPAEQVEEFVRRVREGRIELTALPFNLHTETCSTDELHELLRLAHDVRDRYGLTFTSAMQTDVPGAVVGLVDALSAAGVKYLSVAHNWAGRSVPHLVGGEKLPRLFRWRAPSGNSVLVWVTDTPHGLAYMEGPLLGFDTDYADVDDLLPAYLTSLATNPYPYRGGIFGWAMDQTEVKREPYPWDVLHLRVQGKFGDNAPPRRIIADTVRRWNETWAHPQLRLSRNEDFFTDAEARLGDAIQTFDGDWTDWWVDGVGSGARPLSLARTAQSVVADAQTIGTFAVLGATGAEEDSADAAGVYEAVSLFDEHTPLNPCEAPPHEGACVYRLDPRYPPAPGTVLTGGWEAVAAQLPSEPAIVAVEGPPAADWDTIAARLTAACPLPVRTLDIRTRYAPPAVVRRRTMSAPDADDPYYCKLAENSLHDLFDELPRDDGEMEDGLLLVYGPGASLVLHDVLWYADLPKRYAEAAVTAGEGNNLGLPSERAESKRLFYVDWPMLDRHRDALAGQLDGWLDVQDPGRPVFLDGDGLRASCAELARRPVRTRPFFNSTPWGGHWGQRELGFNPGARNTALGYELIAPEAGILIGDGPETQAEVPFQLLCVLHPEEVLGPEAHARFGTSFPIRFDYLDTVGGGNLSVHCHPKEPYMRERFGWHYTQHETYYTMLAGTDSRVYLGLREDADLALFRKEIEEAAHDGVPMDPADHVMTFPAEQGRLFTIPAGTPHASGAGNLVLEISATPYLYSLRFYDWLRPDADGNPRPLPYEHGLTNLETERRGAAVTRDLVQEPYVLRRGYGWREELLGALDEMFYEVRRYALDADAVAPDDTAGRFHVLNVVEGEGVTVLTSAGERHTLAYAETLTVPAAVGGYRLEARDGPAKVVKALVRDRRGASAGHP